MQGTQKIGAVESTLFLFSGKQKGANSILLINSNLRFTGSLYNQTGRAESECESKGINSLII